MTVACRGCPGSPRSPRRPSSLPRHPAAADDFAATALNIIPSGQYGSVPPAPGADAQAKMYDALTPLFDQVTDADLHDEFKSERFGVGADGPGRRARRCRARA